MLPTPRLAALLALALLPAAFAIAWPSAVYLCLAWDLGCLAAFAIDRRRCPRPDLLDASRVVEDVVSAGAPNRARVEVDNLAPFAVAGELADAPPPTCACRGPRTRFEIPAHGRWAHTYLFTPGTRGDHRFGDLFLRTRGPWGLAMRQARIAAAKTVRAYPDLRALARESLFPAHPQLESGLSRLRRSLGEGRAFESLREYVPGDDVRSIDWKATAKRSRPIARQYEPERNQTVMLLVDCGRHMVSRVGKRTKLDFTIDASLRLARATLDRGDQVGLCAFGAKILAYLPPKKGRLQLRALVDLLVPLQPELEESDYDSAFGLAASRQRRRALMATFTDVLDEDSSRSLLLRILSLRPRHLPLVVAAADAVVLGRARAIPEDASAAYARAAARQIVQERERTIARLRDAGAHVVDVPVSELSAAAINEYLAIKSRGLL
jgi:uncharacterized protein (DUF58 family)